MCCQLSPVPLFPPCPKWHQLSHTHCQKAVSSVEEDDHSLKEILSRNDKILSRRDFKQKRNLKWKVRLQHRNLNDCKRGNCSD